jgi:hypothetical protein
MALDQNGGCEDAKKTTERARGNREFRTEPIGRAKCQCSLRTCFTCQAELAAIATEERDNQAQYESGATSDCFFGR